MSEGVADRMSKTGAATHTQCRLWVKSRQTAANRNRPLSALVQKRTK